MDNKCTSNRSLHHSQHWIDL